MSADKTPTAQAPGEQTAGKPCTCSQQGVYCRGAANLGAGWYCERAAPAAQQAATPCRDFEPPPGSLICFDDDGEGVALCGGSKHAATSHIASLVTCAECQAKIHEAAQQAPATPERPTVNACQVRAETPKDRAAVASVIEAARARMDAVRCYAVHPGRAFCGRPDPEALTDVPKRITCTACVEAGPLPTTDAERAEWERDRAQKRANFCAAAAKDLDEERRALLTERREALTIALRAAEELDAVPDDSTSLLSVLEAIESAAHGATDEIAALSEQPAQQAPAPAAEPLTPRSSAVLAGVTDRDDALAMLSAGSSIKDAAEMVGRSVETVRAWQAEVSKGAESLTLDGYYIDDGSAQHYVAARNVRDALRVLEALEMFAEDTYELTVKPIDDDDLPKGKIHQSEDAERPDGYTLREALDKARAEGKAQLLSTSEF